MAIANTHSQWINGAQVWYPHGNEQRWIDAFGENVVKYIEDFEVTPSSTAATQAANNPEWVITHTSGDGGASKESTVTAADFKGGWLRLSPGSSEDDGINMQHANESFRVEPDSWLYFGIRYKTGAEETTEQDFILGLAEQDVSVITNTSHGIYFRSTDGGSNIKCCVVRDETTVATLVATTDCQEDTVFIDEFIAKSTGSVEFWHNGSTVGKYTTGIPSTDLAVTLAFFTGASNSSQDIYIDWIRCIQLLDKRTT